MDLLSKISLLILIATACRQLYDLTTSDSLFIETIETFTIINASLKSGGCQKFNDSMVVHLISVDINQTCDFNYREIHTCLKNNTMTSEQIIQDSKILSSGRFTHCKFNSEKIMFITWMIAIIWILTLVILGGWS